MRWKVLALITVAVLPGIMQGCDVCNVLDQISGLLPPQAQDLLNQIVAAIGINCGLTA